MTDTSSLSHLIERLEKATGPDRETDLAIQLAIEPDGDIAGLMQFRRGFDGKPGMAWDIHHGGSVCFEKHDDSGRCFYNGGYPLPFYTKSIDAAMTLVQENWRVNNGDFSVEGRFTWMLTLTGQHRTDWFARRRDMADDYDGDPLYMSGQGRSLPLALCIAALKAQLSTRTNEQDDARNLSGVSSE